MQCLFMDKKCLVLGGDGFLGSHLVDDLLSRGFDVRVFDKLDGKKARNLVYPQDRLELFSGDFFDPVSIDAALEGIAFVFHFISLGSPISTINNPKKDIEDNVIGTINLLEACVKAGVKRIIYPSSGGAIYGDVKEGFASEDYPSNPITPYSINKLCIENYFGYYKRYYNLDFIVYRIANPYGERQSTDGTQGIIPILLRKVLLGEVIDIYGNSVRDYIYVKDATGMIAASFDKECKYNIYNLGSGKGASLADILTIIESVTHIKPKINQLEKREFDVERIVLDISRIKEEFHFTPTADLANGIQMTFDAIQQKIEQNR